MEEERGRLTTFPAGSTILKEGESSNEMFKILKGHAEVYVGYGTGHEALIGIIGPQACFGEYGILLDRPAIYTVIAYSDVYALCVTEKGIGDFIRDNHSNVLDMMKNMAGMMATMRMQVDLLMSDIEAGRKPDVKTVRELRRSMRGYSIYNPHSGRIDM